MRTTISIIVAILIPVLAFSQNKPTQRVILKNGSAINGTVQLMADGTYEVKSASGDTFYFLPSEVERVIGLSQENDTDKNGNVKKGRNEVEGPVIRYRNTLRFSGSSTELSQNDFLSNDSWNKYLNNRKKGKTGRILLYSGLGGIALGGIEIGIGLSNDNNKVLQYIGTAFIAAGLGVAIAGLSMTISSNKNLNQMANEFNPNPGYALNFGMQQHGLGFALNF